MINLAKKYIGINQAQKLELMKFYNSNCVQLVKPSRRYNIQPNDNWCAMFTSVIAFKNGVDNFPYEVSVMEQVKIAKENNTFYKDVDSISVGDLIVYDWDGSGWCDHVGFIASFDNDNIEALEGNKNNTVNYRYLKKSSKSIYGFIKI